MLDGVANIDAVNELREATRQRSLCDTSMRCVEMSGQQLSTLVAR
jgi:hypothetical protein